MNKTFGSLTAMAVAMALAGCANEPAGPDQSADDATPAAAEAGASGATQTAGLCEGFGPQTPRDIANPAGTNPVDFAMAPQSDKLNLCNIHTHTHAEHKGPGFTLRAVDSEHGGYRCNGTDALTERELTPPFGGAGAYGDVKPGDTIEVHWVYSSCDVAPGEGLGSCLSDACEDPKLRVESQVFLLVNDPEAFDFREFAYGRTRIDGVHQPKALPSGTGEPVVFRGSTTGPSYTQQVCSPLQVTWSVRPQCTKLDIATLHRWAENGNVFNETKSHGVRELVTAPELLAPIE